ncbi:MAG: acireductone synthase [Pseudomonadota bacterium]|nr:acireductone synthase [Pseudomonadota bacterium]
MSTKAILTDIEGTTSSISFVRDVLFPYARKALPTFVQTHGNDPQVRKWLDAVAAENGAVCNDAVLAEVLQGWIDQDRKHTALKALQGIIWAEGYRKGDFTAHMYPDAPQSLGDWHAAGMPLYVYSSGSVPAQQLFFGYSDAGDLTGLVSGWFDTEVGGKRQAGSYARIAESIGLPPRQILFLSDVVEELDAARDAGMDTVLVDRLDDYAQPRRGEATHGHARVESFSDVRLRD